MQPSACASTSPPPFRHEWRGFEQANRGHILLSVNLRRSGRGHRWLGECTLALALALSAPAGRAWAQGDVQPEVMVAVLRDAAPFSYQAPDGTWKGLAVEMWDMVARQLHLDSRFTGMNRSELVDAVSTGQALRDRLALHHR